MTKLQFTALWLLGMAILFNNWDRRMARGWDAIVMRFLFCAGSIAAFFWALAL